MANKLLRRALIVGKGGREHALGYALSKNVDELFFAPGTGGTSLLGTNLPNIASTDVDQLLSFAKKNRVELTVVGPEDALAVGIVDAFQKENIKIFGPTKQAAQLEVSKTFAVDFMKRYNIPSPDYFATGSYDEAKQYVKENDPLQYVIKAQGPAAGKGVHLPSSRKEALKSIQRMMANKEYGPSGEVVLFQERIQGPEVSLLAFSDGKTIIPLPPAQDHKRAFDNDLGPNTGGMGAYAPTPLLTPQLLETVQNTILQPTIDGIRKEGTPFTGIVYAGLMLTESGPKVLEYNVRFGDPETQPLMMLLKSDLAAILLSTTNETLHKTPIRFKDGAAVCVVLASNGYPDMPQKGQSIYGLDKIKENDIAIFHSGTDKNEDQFMVNGGRVLGVTAYGKNIKEAVKKAYGVIGENQIHFDGMFYRHDIASQVITS